MFFKTYRIVNSKNKKNLRYVALGSCQIEFFTLGEIEYFALYKFYGNNAKWMLVNLSEAAVQKTNKGFEITESGRLYKIHVSEHKKDPYMEIVRFMWGWLPLQWYSGKLSAKGLLTINQALNPFVEEL